MILYNRLWETMREKGISQYRLIKYYGFSSGQLSRLKQNAYVSTHTLDVLCTILNCSIEDVMEFRLDASYNPALGLYQSDGDDVLTAKGQPLPEDPDTDEEDGPQAE